jgi:hypothetical protein
MNNYKELSFLISSLFVIYFFKDIITTLIILVILSSISLLLVKGDFDKIINGGEQPEFPNSNSKNTGSGNSVNSLNSNSKKPGLPTNNGNTNTKEQYKSSQNPDNFVKSPNFVYNR